MKNLLFVIIFISPLLCWAQAEQKGNSETIVITRKGSRADKLKIEIDGRNITVNGKNANDDTTISVRRMNSSIAYPGVELRKMRPNEKIRIDSFLNNYSSNKAFLGVATEATEEGLVIKNIVDESAAAKTGLKEGDILLSVEDKVVKTPDELSDIIATKKPKDRIAIKYKRDKKQFSTEAILGATNSDINFNKIFGFPNDVKGPFGREEFEILKNWNGNNGFRDHYSTYNNTPKLGIQIADDENSDLVKIVKVDPKSAAEFAGLQVGDIIAKVDDKPVLSVTDAIAKIEEAKRKKLFTIGISRKGKQQNVQIKIAKKIVTKDL
ncbi:MAG: PDZ domain-containing protein [Bacteroidia bacterium]|nr:MAG: PDZ domain-containing protein [Bacteroidia bacterium]